MTKRRKRKAAVPDEAFVAGPLRLARYGSNVVFESELSKREHAKIQERAVAIYPEIVNQIDQLVQAIAKLVSELPADKLLHRAWWEFASRAVKLDSEVDIDLDDAVSLRMIDYIQSIIASVNSAENQRDEVTEEEWQKLREKVASLFHEVSVNYQICRTAKAKAEDLQYNDDVEEFYFKAQVYWCNVRGARYQVHQVAYLRDMFLPHSDVMQELFGLNAEEFIDELTKILHALTFGIQEIVTEMESFRRDTMAAVNAKLELEPPSGKVDFPAVMQAVIEENGWEDRQKRIFGRTFGTDLFDIQEITSLPRTLIEELTWGAGEEPDFLAEGDLSGWPLRIWPVFKRPFIRLNGRCCCFDLNSLFDNIYRVMQRLILRQKPDYVQTWNWVQQQQSEELPFKYFERILPGATTYRPVFYRWHSSPNASGKDWCEADGLLIYDDCLFIIEVRAGAFTYTSPADDFPAFIASLKNLVLKPATQGQRFLDYLGSADTVSIFDEGHAKLGELHKADFRQMVICPITLDPFTEMAAQVQHLRKIGVDVGNHPVWALSLDDVRVYADIFEDPLCFLHYVDQRMRAFASDIIRADDELDHLGLYIKHNNYSLYAEQLQGDSDARINFTGYRSEIDKFFHERLYDTATPCLIRQEAPERILEVISFLSGGELAGRAALSAYLLDFDEQTRQSISTYIEQELTGQRGTRRPKPCSIHGGVALTVYCYARPWTQRDADRALDHARAIQLVNNDERRFLLELTYDDKGELADLNWQWLELSGISPQELPRLTRVAEKLRETRVATAKAQRRKIGRNEPCPCGSGKKYKKCCLNNQSP